MPSASSAPYETPLNTPPIGKAVKTGGEKQKRRTHSGRQSIGNSSSAPAPSSAWSSTVAAQTRAVEYLEQYLALCKQVMAAPDGTEERA